MKQIFWILVTTIVAAGNAWAQLPQGSFGENSLKKWEVMEWALDNPSYSGNPFDLDARVTFRHEASGEVRTTDMFYDGGNIWRFRFIPTQEGVWTFSSSSHDSDLNAKSGHISVKPAQKGATGFVVAKGDKFVLEGRGDLAITPHFIMAGDGAKAIESTIDSTLETFVNGHGFNGVHLVMFCSWFKYDKNTCDGMNANTNPDIRSFRALENALIKTRNYGAVAHIWVWGDDGSRRNPARFVGLNSTSDRRLQKYMAARLAAFPNWTMGYGYDLFEWVKGSELDNWHAYMQSKMGWKHLLGARSDLNQLSQLSEKMDYSSYEQHKPSFNTYIATIAKRPNKPSFSEDRFRVAQKNGFAYKDYTFEETRRGLWHSSMVGGVAGIWGFLNGQIVDVSYPYPQPTAQQIKTYFKFFDNRFYQNMKMCNDLVPGSQDSSGDYPRFNSTKEKDVVLEAAQWARKTHPRFFVPNASRELAYEMMTVIINALRANGWDARRTLANPSAPPTNPFRWGSDALVMGSNQNIIYDIYISWPSPATPTASYHGNQEGEITHDLIPQGAGGNQIGGDPKVGVCLKSENEKYIFYRESGKSIAMNLTGMNGLQRVIAVDTKKPYEEILVGSFGPGNHTWSAPYESDWALAIGSFSSESVGAEFTENFASMLYKAVLHRDGDEGGLKSLTEFLKTSTSNRISTVASNLADSDEFRSKIAGLSSKEVVEKLYQSILKREADPSGMGAYEPLVKQGRVTEVVSALVGSKEWSEKQSFFNSSESEYAVEMVHVLYRDVLFRKDGADFPGANGAVNTLRNYQLHPFKEAARAYVSSDEFKERIAPKSNAEKLAVLYRELLGREPDAGSAGWLEQLNNGMPFVNAVIGFIESQEFHDRVFMNNGVPTP